MANAVFLVYTNCIAACGLKVYAICSDRKAAEMARSRVAKGKEKLPGERTRYYDLPVGHTYAAQLRIVKVLVDRLYPEGLDEKKLEEFAGNLNEQEIIR